MGKPENNHYHHQKKAGSTERGKGGERERERGTDHVIQLEEGPRVFPLAQQRAEQDVWDLSETCHQGAGLCLECGLLLAPPRD